jgi:mRNA interferase RelE/StbE
VAYTVELKPAAVRDLKAIPERERKRIKTRIDALAENPRPHGAKALQGGEGYLRIRVGDYRIIYTVLDRLLLVVVIRVGNRRDVYRR